MQPSRLAKDLAQTPDPKVRGTPVRMVGLHATEAAEATLLPFFARAGSVSPPWFGEPHVVPRESNIVRRLANTQPGAAGVSPPWVGNTLATAFRLSDRPVVVTGESRFRFCKRGSLTTAGLRQPLLVPRRMCGAVRRWTECCDNYRRRSTHWGESNALGYEDSKPAAGS